MGKRMSKASYNSGRKIEDDVVAARQFEVNECKVITTEKEMIMELLAKVEMVRVFEG